MLDLARDLAVLEAAEDGADLSIIAGVQAVDDGLGALVGVVQGAQQGCDLAAAGSGVDHVVAGVGIAMQILTAFALLIPAFSLLYTPQPLTLLFLRVYNAPLPNPCLLYTSRNRPDMRPERNRCEHRSGCGPCASCRG